MAAVCAPLRGIPGRPVRLEVMDVAREVIAAAEGRASALVSGDPERLGELLHEQFRWTTHAGETFNRSDYIRRNTTGHTIWLSQVLTDIEVLVVGRYRRSPGRGH